MKKHSCGAILYTIWNNKIYVVLGMEEGEWFPFKGTKDIGETYEETAIREIREETCNVIKVNSIKLDCNYSTKRKHYHIGITQINKNDINQFYKNRNAILKNSYDYHLKNYAYLEKTNLKMFLLDDIFQYDFHEITLYPIKYYYTFLKNKQKKLNMSKLHSLWKVPFQNCIELSDIIPISHI
jgi:hypothetical protein